MKKYLTLLATLGFALGFSTTYASTMASANYAPSITIPNLKPGFAFNLTALALKPGASNLNYVIYNNELPTQSPTWTEKELRPGYSAAIELGVSYVLSEGRNINLDWTHLNSNTSASVAAPNAAFFLGPDYEIGPEALPIRYAYGAARFMYDVVNLDFGQFVKFGQRVQLRLFGGLSNTYLREQINSTYSGNTTTGSYIGPFSTQQIVSSNFTGLGPRFGFDADYSLDHGFGILGEAAASALIGSSYSKTTYNSAAQKLLVVYGQTSNSQFILDQHVTQVIPGFDAKLGLNYKHTFSRGLLLTVKAGYQAAVYINAINQYIPASLVRGAPLDTGGIFVATMSHTLSNYSVQGPFLMASIQL